MKYKSYQYELLPYLVTNQVLGSYKLKSVYVRQWENGSCGLFIRVMKKTCTTTEKVPYIGNEKVNLAALSPRERDYVTYKAETVDHFCEYGINVSNGRWLEWNRIDTNGAEPVGQFPGNLRLVDFSHFCAMITEGKAKPSRLEVVGKNAGILFDEGAKLVDSFGGGYCLKSKAGTLYSFGSAVFRAFSVKG